MDASIISIVAKLMLCLILHNQCALANPDPSPMKGRNAYSTRLSLPFVAAVVEKNGPTKERSSLCTGTIISRNQVLTAASCLENRLLQDLEVVRGSLTLSAFQSYSFGIISKVTYKDYEEASKLEGNALFPELDDICILELDTYHSGVIPANIIYQTNLPVLESEITIVGWGPTAKTSHSPPIAYYAKMRIMQKQDCNQEIRFFAPNFKKLLWANKIFCVHNNRKTYVVDGDFGGPALVDEDKLIGIIIRPQPTRDQFIAISKAEPIMGNEIYSSKKSHPFVVLIAKINEASGEEKRLCSGSMISKNQVLTVASCLENEPTQNLEVFIGNSSPSSIDFNVFKVSSKVTYKEYADELLQNGIFVFRQVDDICILTLQVTDTGFEQAVISYDTNKPTIGDSVTFVTWGPTRDRYLPNVPRYVTLKVLQKQECDDFAKIFTPNYRKLAWSNKVFCIQKDNIVNVVDGDFGGPVLFDGNKLVGMAIRPRPSPEPIKVTYRQPILVLRIGIYKDFIEKYLKI
ncbi:hypothetical protein QAD02_011587 [Eretmocerus hayati]|uniref:Uncharacterized protein n=1 Tax=Eretmocerus hayati TaxID=131215 RepID=A0ACC2NXC7_9HYME|nr:hypothetical protein QAD02_011587 [Eretmocerus hayati]